MSGLLLADHLGHRPGLRLQFVQAVDAGHLDEPVQRPDRPHPEPDRGIRIERQPAIGGERHMREAGDVGDGGASGGQKDGVFQMVLQQFEKSVSFGFRQLMIDGSFE